jgi:uncharacterized membrane protein YdjX (TVP38/TMEM64 family)
VYFFINFSTKNQKSYGRVYILNDKLRRGFFAILIGVLFLLYNYFKADQHYFLSVLDRIQSLEKLSLLIFCLLFIITNLLLIPIGLPLNLYAGMVWGTAMGGVIISLLATFVAGLAFILSRVFGGMIFGPLYKWFPVLRKFKTLINCSDANFIFASRINPFVPFGVSNYMFGLVEDLSFKRYISVTMVANSIPCFAFAAIGDTLKTFSAYDNDVHTAVLKVGFTLALVSILIFIKSFTKKSNIKSVQV